MREALVQVDVCDKVEMFFVVREKREKENSKAAQLLIYPAIAEEQTATADSWHAARRSAKQTTSCFG